MIAGSEVVRKKNNTTSNDSSPHHDDNRTSTTAAAAPVDLTQHQAARIRASNSLVKGVCNGIPTTTSSSIDDVAHSHQADNTNHNEVAICAIVLREERYIQEWIDFHRGIGINKFHIYDNSDGFEMKEWLLSSSSKDTENNNLCGVTIHHWPGKSVQGSSYVHCQLQLMKSKEVQYAAMMDLDEFIVLHQHDTIQQVLTEYLLPFGGALGINWYMVGNGGNQRYSPEPVTKRFQYREDKVAHLIKSIAVVSDLHPYYTTRMHGFMYYLWERLRHYYDLRWYVPVDGLHPHFSFLKPNKTTRDTNGNVIESASNWDGPGDVVNIYHYHEKSVQEFHEKLSRGRADQSKFRESLNSTGWFGEVWDDSAWQQLQRTVPKYKQLYGNTTTAAATTKG